jgi:hypothetical protein
VGGLQVFSFFPIDFWQNKGHEKNYLKCWVGRMLNIQKSHAGRASSEDLSTNGVQFPHFYNSEGMDLDIGKHHRSPK